jgi:hypothetical protein
MGIMATAGTSIYRVQSIRFQSSTMSVALEAGRPVVDDYFRFAMFAFISLRLSLSLSLPLLHAQLCCI